MTNSTTLLSLTDSAHAAKLHDQEWVRLHVPRFKRVRRYYLDYGDFLSDVLNEFCRRVAPLAIVQARVKGVSSFAEKILRKRKSYVDASVPLPPDPLVRLTDLCGARLIVQTSEQVRTVCQFIERAFDIDWPNSEDVSQRLKPTEFGYRSVHYIVMANEAKLREVGIEKKVPAVLRGFASKVVGPTAANRPLKAEIQVRTLLEHAWSDIGHDMTYKTDLKVPGNIVRQFATVAAVLEGADREFGQLVHAFSTYRANLGAHHSRKEVEEEIERQKTVLDCEPENVDLALKLARLYHVMGRHEDAIDVLDRKGWCEEPEVQRYLGLLLTEVHWDRPAEAEFRRGYDLLDQACSGMETDAETLCAFAECVAHLGKVVRARELFKKAVALDATQPLVLCRYLEFEIEKAGNTNLVQLTAPMIRSAMDRAHRQIEARVNLPNAWFSLAVFHLLLQEPFSALSALGQAGCLCEPASGKDKAATARPCAAGHILQRARATMERLRPVSRTLEGFTWFERFLLLILAVRLGSDEVATELSRLTSVNSPVSNRDDQVVILAGGCAPEVNKYMNDLRKPLVQASKGIAFTLISGGTQAGVSGVAADLATRCGENVRAFWYLPGHVPLHTVTDEGTKRSGGHNPSNGVDFTPLEPLQTWIDLVHAGVQPSRVKLLCYAPGKVAHAECMIAMTLGARVGVIDNPRLPKERRFNASEWTTHPCFAPLPLDPMTLRAFLQIDTAPLVEAQKKRLERAARMTHEDYMKSATPKDPSLQPWDKLDNSLKLSNYHQVAYWEGVLQEYGLGVRQLTQQDKRHDPLDLEKELGKSGIRKLAAIEHGRWNIERLYYGWRYAREKDVARRLSPYLVPWVEVPSKIQKLDLDAMRSLPKKLREAGLELIRIRRGKRT